MATGDTKLNDAAQGNGTVNGKLLSQHLADLRKSGLSDDQIARCGFHSLHSPSSVQKVLGWKRYRGELGPCLAIPFVGADGMRTNYFRLKPDRPRKSKEGGKPIKYESPKGAANRAFFPPGTLAVLPDAARPLIVTEGEKKAAKADQEGYPCIGLVGVYGWQKKRRQDKNGNADGERELIDGLAAVAWQGRIVYVCYDSDAITNPHVREAQWHLAECLMRHGASVKFVRLPPADPDGDGNACKVGLDDFLVVRGPEALRALLADASDAEPPAGVAPMEADDDPHRLARLFLAGQCHHVDGGTLQFWHKKWHRWERNAYRLLPDNELRAELTKIAKAEMDRLNLAAQKVATAKGKPLPTARKVTAGLTADIAHALASLTVLAAHIEAPSWLEGDGPFPPLEMLACGNGLVHLPSLVSNRDHFLRPTPLFFSPNVLSFDFKPDSPPPTAWLDFLSQLWPSDAESITTLQEWLGYLLMPDTRQQKILLLVGPKRSGKGTIARIIQALVGPDNVAAPTLASLGTNFGLWPLLGKTVALIHDARLSARQDLAVITERLLSISGDDAQNIDRKFLSPVTAKLLTRFVILTNELPKLSDSSGALPGRIILLKLTKSWFGKEDINLAKRLLNELPGILLWAIAGWQRLWERGHFTQPDSGKKLMNELEDLSSPVGAFVRMCCKVGLGFTVEKAVLYGRWKAWCKGQGREHPGDAATFGRNLRAAVPNLGEAYPRTENGRVYCYEGITLV